MWPVPAKKTSTKKRILIIATCHTAKATIPIPLKKLNSHKIKGERITLSKLFIDMFVVIKLCNSIDNSIKNTPALTPKAYKQINDVKVINSMAIILLWKYIHINATTAFIPRNTAMISTFLKNRMTPNTARSIRTILIYFLKSFFVSRSNVCRAYFVSRSTASIACFTYRITVLGDRKYLFVLENVTLAYKELVPWSLSQGGLIHAGPPRSFSAHWMWAVLLRTSSYKEIFQ
jgi:hypothetical protein